MISIKNTVQEIEDFLYKKLALFIVLTIALLISVNLNFSQSTTHAKLITDQKKEIDSINLKHKAEIFSKDSLIFICNERERITRDLSTKREIDRADKFEDLYLEVSEMKAKLKRKNQLK